MRIERTIRFPQQPPLPVSVFFAQLRCPGMQPLLPLRPDVRLHFTWTSGIHGRESPSLLIHIPFLFNMNDVADST